MKKDLTSSHIDRQNILNNKYALEAIQTELGMSVNIFESEKAKTLRSAILDIVLDTLNKRTDKGLR